MSQAPSYSLLSFAVVAGCTASSAATPAPVAAAPAPPSAGNLPTTAAPDRDAADIAALRAKGRAGLDEILAQYDRAAPTRRAALGATVDAVAAQRYATVSRLYWYTDEQAALAEARRSGRPILALRMLGRLDEDLSCANSRFFRTALYPDERVAGLLRDKFVLLWTSERPVPRVTIDYGDGRALLGTVTGNSIHYVLDAEGQVVDALPGLYAPAIFAAELALVLAEVERERRAGALGDARLAHRQQRWAHRAEGLAGKLQEALGAIWVPGSRRLLTPRDVQSMVERAQAAAMSKARVEVPLIHRVLPGVDPGQGGDGDVARWASIGQTVFGIGEVDLRAEVGGQLGQLGQLGQEGQAPEAAPRRLRRVASAIRNAVARRAVGARAEDPPPVLGQRARALVAEVFAGGASAAGGGHDAAAVVARFEQRMVADTALAQLQLRPRILARLAEAPQATMASLNTWVYAELFATPRQDLWLGLLPRDEYTGLPGDGVVLPR